MSELYISTLRDHPLTAALLGLLFILVAPLSVFHTLRIFGGILVSIMQDYRHEYESLSKVADDLWREIRKWFD